MQQQPQENNNIESLNVLTEAETVEIRTFEGAYWRTSLSAFGFALIILRIFQDSFYRIGIVFVVYGGILLFISLFKRNNTSYIIDKDKPFVTSGVFVLLVGNGPSSGQTIIDEHFQPNILPNYSNIMSSTSKVDGKTKNKNGSGDESGSNDKNESGGNVRGNGKLKRSIDTLNSNDSSIANHNADNDNDNDGDKDVEEINGEKKQVKKRKTNSGNKNVTIEDNSDAKMNLDFGLDDLDDDNDNQDKNSGANEKAINNNQKINKKKTQIEHQQENPTNQVNNKKESSEEKQANKNKNKNNKKKDDNSNSKTNDKSPNSQEKKVKNVDGVSITEAKVGMGKQAKNGKKDNGKVFDSNTTGRPFFFTLGKAEVIKGWEIGINGMCVGGERKLVIPPALAYGTKGHPPTIPKGATLEFEVKLLKVD
nr:11734_t:CDS:2 [Entrophospora candida]